MPQALMEAKQYSYCHGQTIDLGPIMLGMQFRMTDEAGTYLCAVQALVFEGSILAYNPTRDEVEWVPTWGLANYLTWAEEKSAIALANYVPHALQKVAHIVQLGAHRLVSWPTDSSTLEEEDEGQEEEEQEEKEEWEEVDADAELKQGEGDGEPEPSRRQ